MLQTLVASPDVGVRAAREARIVPSTRCAEKSVAKVRGVRLMAILELKTVRSSTSAFKCLYKSTLARLSNQHLAT